MVKLRDYEIIGIFVILGIAGVLLLFSMNFDVQSSILNLFLPINTSLWEFGKLLFVSLFVYALFEYFTFGKSYDNFWFAKLSSLVFGPVCYILLTYVIDLSFSNANILVHGLMFFLSITLSQYLSYYFMERHVYFKFMNVYAVLSIFILFMTFALYADNKGFSSPIFSPMKTYQDQIARVEYY